MWDKPFKTYDGQVTHLINKYGLLIQDRDFAVRLLSSISYYDLINGYQECFMVNERYDNTSIEDLYDFLVFDKNIQAVLFKYSVYAENRFKVNLAYVLAEKFGEHQDDYLNTDNYRPEAKDLIDKIKKDINSEKVDNPVKHYKETKNHIPPWILIKSITFNDAIDLFSYLKHQEKKEICNLLLPRFEGENSLGLIKNSLIIIRKFRNKIAHNLKFITYRANSNQLILKNLSKLYGGGLIEKIDFQENRGKNDVYSMIIALSLILHEYHLIQKFYKEILIQTGLLENEDVFLKYCKITNIPKNINKRFENQMKKYFKNK